MFRAQFSRHRLLFVALALLAAVACRSTESRKQRHFERGNQYVAEQKDKFAVIEYANAVKLDPKFGEARWRLAQTLERMENARAAFPEFIRAADALPDNRDAQIKATQLLLLSGRFEDARARATTLLQKNPRDVDALVLRGNAMAMLKDPASAIREFEEALKVQRDAAGAWVGLGAVRLGAGQIRDAEDAFRQAVEQDPKSIDARLSLANFLSAAGRWVEAEKAVTDALTLDSRHLLANRMLAVLYLIQGREADLEAPLKVLADVSKTVESRMQLADHYTRIGRIADAKLMLTEIATDQRGFAAANTALALIEYRQKQPDAARKRVDGVLAQAPKYVPALLAKAEWFANENRLDDALASAKAAVAAGPDVASAHFTLGTIQKRRRQTSDAIKSFTEVLRISPRSGAAQLELAGLHLIGGNRAAALQYAEEAKKALPGSTSAGIMLARALVASGNLPRAQTEISGLLRAHPDQAKVHTMSGLLEVQRKDYESAARSFSKALAIAPDDMETLRAMLSLELQTKKTDRAVGRIESALARQPAHPELLSLSAQVYAIAGQTDRAEQALRKVIATDPGFSSAYAMLAELYLNQRRTEEARQEFERIVARDPSDVGARTMVGMLYHAQNNTAEAKKWYEGALAQSDNAPTAANNLAYLYAEEGVNLDMALQLASSAKQHAPDNPGIDDTLGWIYYKKGIPTLAVGPLQESLRKRPDHPETLYHLGLVYAKMGDKAKATDALNRALKLNGTFNGNDVARQTLLALAK